MNIYLWYFFLSFSSNGKHSRIVVIIARSYDTVKPVCNDHLYNKIYYLWFI